MKHEDINVKHYLPEDETTDAAREILVAGRDPVVLKVDAAVAKREDEEQKSFNLFPKVSDNVKDDLRYKMGFLAGIAWRREFLQAIETYMHQDEGESE